MQRECCWLRAMVLCVSGASASAQDIFLDQRSYIEAFEAPRLFYTLRNYMREPGMLLELSRPAFSMEVIGGQEACGLSEAEELRQWLFTQTVAVSDRVEGSAITMCASFINSCTVRCRPSRVHLTGC